MSSDRGRPKASSRKAFLLGLKERGFSGVEFCVSDDHASLEKAIAEALPETACDKNVLILNSWYDRHQLGAIDETRATAWLIYTASRCPEGEAARERPLQTSSFP